MVDFWLTLGTMVADDRLFKLVTSFTTGKTNYKRMGTKVTFGNPDIQNPDIDAATFTNKEGGIYLENPTVGLRDTLFMFFQKEYPDFKIPVSLYCAGLLCSLVDATPPARGKHFLTAIGEQTDAYGKLAAKPPITREFLITLGLALIDNGVRISIKDQDTQALFARLYFIPAQAHKDVLEAIVKPLLEVGGDFILTGPRWGEGCLQVHDFYDKFRYAIG